MLRMTITLNAVVDATEECLSYPIRTRQVVEADQRAAEGEERLMDVGPPLGADRQPPIPVQPRQGALDHPAVPTQPLAGLDPPPRDPHRDVARAQEPSAAGEVVRLVGMELGRAFAPAARRGTDQWHGIDQVREHYAVMAVGPGQEVGQRNTLAIGDQVPFGAGLAAIGRVRSDRVAPLLAGTLAMSRLARSQSMRSASPRRSRSVRCKRSQTPACCQSRRRHQQVTPEPQPLSTGRYSHGMPLLSTKRMPVKQARSGTRGWPPLGLGGSGGSSGATMAQSTSGRRGLLMALDYHAATGFERHSSCMGKGAS